MYDWVVPDPRNSRLLRSSLRSSSLSGSVVTLLIWGEKNCNHRHLPRFLWVNSEQPIVLYLRLVLDCLLSKSWKID